MLVVFPTILSDLCSRGAGIVMYHALEAHERIDIIIKVPYLFDTPIYKAAKVVWCKKIDENFWQCGLAFNEDDKIIFFK